MNTPPTQIDPVLDEFRVPWDEKPRKALTKLVESGRLKPGKAIELGCGAARNAIYLARHGFDVTGVDSDPGLVARAYRKAMAARVIARFVVDDLTNLKKVNGPFDVLIDYSTMDDLIPEQRDRYVQSILPLTQPGSQFVLYCLEWTLSWWEKLTMRLLSVGALTLEPGEVRHRFGEYFHINKIIEENQRKDYPRGFAVYLMTRKAVPAIAG